MSRWTSRRSRLFEGLLIRAGRPDEVGTFSIYSHFQRKTVRHKHYLRLSSLGGRKLGRRRESVECCIFATLRHVAWFPEIVGAGMGG